MIHSVERSTTLRSTNIRQAQQMHNVARRLMHIQRHSPVALLVEPDLHTHTTEPIVNAIRGGRIVRIRWSELTPGEQREAYHNYFQPNCYE